MTMFIRTWYSAGNEGDVAPGPGRLRLLLAAIALGALAVFARVVALECFYGPAYRAEATRPLEHPRRVPGVRGRILARDGTVLAYDRPIASLALAYRYLEEPPNPVWLEAQARRRLPHDQRRRRERIAAEIERVRADRDELHRRLALLCGHTLNELRRRAAAIQDRVERIARQVNQRRQERLFAETADRPRPADDAPGGWRRLLALAFPPADEPRAAPLTIVEEFDDHVLFADVSPEVGGEVETHPELYPGVRIVADTRRTYPQATLAAHVLGHLGPAVADEPAGDDAARQAPPWPGYTGGERVGRLGAERRFEPLLRAVEGIEIERRGRDGRPRPSEQRRAPQNGCDLLLTIDAALQRTAESLLDAAVLRRAAAPADGAPADGAPAGRGGAIVVIDVDEGSLLALASAPRFDPNAFSDARAAGSLLDAPDDPLYDRATRMALAPGSVFKVLTSVALLETGFVSAGEPFECRGYLHDPAGQRCEVFRRFGMGHGAVTLVDALAHSCNVYFFHHAGQMGAGPLVEWARRFGFGRPTGVDLPDEAAGNLPAPDANRAGRAGWQTRDTQALAIGQSELTATPLQVARLMAAVANGGRLVTPHVAAGALRDERPVDAASDERALLHVPARGAIPGLRESTLKTLRQGLWEVVAAPDGTGHAAFLSSTPIAGKTGTAQTAADEDHAWFAGYAPAQAPRFAFVIVLEHGGGGGEAAAPLARRLVLRLEELGYL